MMHMYLNVILHGNYKELSYVLVVNGNIFPAIFGQYLETGLQLPFHN